MVSPEIMRDTDRLLKSKQPVMLSVVDTRNRSVTEKPVRLSVKETGMLNLKNCRLNDAKCVSGNNNILLLSRSEMEPSARTAGSSAAVCRTISKSVILPQNNKISQIGLSKRRDTLSASGLQKTSWSGQTSPTLRKLSVRAVRLESKVSAPSSLASLASQEPNKIQTTAVKLGRKTEPPLEPINLSLKPQDTQGEDRERKLFLKIVDEKKLKYNQEDEDRSKLAERRNVSELSIIPVIKLSESPNLTETETITKDSDDEEGLENREDIDDDEESFLQRIGEEIGDMVQVKLECEADAGESQQQNKKLSFSCPKCNRTYSKKSLCELHMKKVHFGLRSKEKCNICGVRFINLQAHKEKYHYFVDVDKCHLCGKVVKYLSSHHCPLQQDLRLKEIKLECPKCGNLVKQKYLKIHQKNHCVGISSTFSNFRTANQVCYCKKQNFSSHILIQELSETGSRIPLHLVSSLTVKSTSASQPNSDRMEGSHSVQQRKEIQLTPR